MVCSGSQCETHKGCWQSQSHSLPNMGMKGKYLGHRGLSGEGDTMLWFWGPLDSHVLLVTWVQWQAGVGWMWPHFPIHLSGSLPFLWTSGLRLKWKHSSTLQAPTCFEDRNALTLIPMLAISPPAPFQPMTLWDGFLCVCH